MRRTTLFLLGLLGLLGACANGDIGGDVERREPLPTTPPEAPLGGARVPFARLSNVELQSSLADLFPTVALPSAALPDELMVDGFDDNVTAQSPSQDFVEAMESLATAAAKLVTSKGSTALGCTIGNAAEEIACGEHYLADLAARAERRPVSKDELAALDALFEAERASRGFERGLASAIAAVLQSPRFLYRVELGRPGAAPDANGRIPLDGYEVASRLSYFFWDSMPDAELFESARVGALDGPRGVEAAARRLLGSDRSKPAVRRLLSQWLEQGRASSIQKDPKAFPGFSDATRASMIESERRFVDRAFFEDGSLRALLTDDRIDVDQELAPIYGVSAPSSGFSLMHVKERAGFLTQAAWLATGADAVADSPVLRGVFLLERLLCAPTPPPPTNVDTTPPPYDGSHPMTTRDRYASTHEQGVCASCHHSIDGLGFGLEHYDAVGAYRTTDSGLPIDATGWFPEGSGDLSGSFDGAQGLAEKLAGSESVARCVASTWTRYALGLSVLEAQKEDLASVVKAFANSDQDLRELLVAIAVSDAFRTRRVQ